MDYTKKQPLGEIYTCLQGEGKYMGVPHILIRVTGCRYYYILVLVTIIYNTDFGTQAATLKGDILEEWSDCNVNKMGVRGSLVGAKYQVQLDGEIVYR